MNITINLEEQLHSIKYVGPMYYMFQDFATDNDLPEDFLQQHLGSKREIMKQVRNWAYKKYKMFVTFNFIHDGAIESINIGFANMSTTEVDEVFCTLFSGEI